MVTKRTARALPPGVIGLPTTTWIAYFADGELSLEQMNVLAGDGCGVRCGASPPLGTIFDIAFRLSTSKETVRAKGEVLGHLPTTPAGLKLRDKLGERAMPAIMSAGAADSATTIFRLDDIKPPTAAAQPKRPKKVTELRGFCLRFLEVDDDGEQAIAHHLRTSKMLADRLAAQAGRSLQDERLAVADTFHEGDLSKRALDW